MTVIALLLQNYGNPEEGDKFPGASHRPFGFDLAHARLLVVGDMAEVHHTRQAAVRATVGA